MLLPAIDGQQQIGDETTKYLNHETVFASGNQVIHLEAPFPPAEEGFYAPAQLINLGHFFSFQVVSVGCYPVVLAVNTVTNKAQLFLTPVYTFGAEKHYPVIEDNTVRIDGILSDDGFVGILPDTADKKLLGGLPLVKVIMTLIVTVHDTGFALVDDLINKGSFTFFAVGQEYLPWDTSVDIETNMGLGFL